jgi:flagellin
MTVINTNINALGAQAALGAANSKQATAMQRLSTGMRINSAADDAAGLAISNRMTSQINGYAVAIRNSNDGISMAQTADSAMGQITTMLQRVRDLAVQSATGTMTAADRSSSQLEVDQLKTQIQAIATQTNINGINLLDGSAGNVQLQTGTNAGQTMSMSFDSMQTKDIGLGSRASLSSVGGLVTSTNNIALSDGSITLNGVSVGASSANSDNLSYIDNANSAIAKAAAINAVSAQSGVFATVGQNTVAGSAITPATGSTAGSTNYVVVNGVTTAAIEMTGVAETDRASIANAINAISGQTGVTASNTHNDDQGITLNAADGRNITTSVGTGSTATVLTSLGLAAAGTYVGSYELNTKDGSAVTVGSTVTHSVDGQQASGLSFGTYQANTAQMVSTVRSNASASAAGSLTGNDLVINGVAIQAANAADDNASSTGNVQSAIAIAAAINKSSAQTGVTATAAANVVAGNAFTASGTVTSVTLNGVAISTDLGANSTRNDVLAELNAYSGQTGVVATANGDGVALTAADGRNITIAFAGGSGTLADLGLSNSGLTAATGGAPQTVYGSVNLSSATSFTVAGGSGGSTTGSNFSKLGFTEGTYGGADNGVKVSQIDITTVQGATDAIKAVDAAITTVSANQSRAGAYENRLNYIVNNLTTENTNITASRSRITDADYGTETTNLAKAQIVQQAATAMLAQANQSQQTVLSLLK